MNEGGGTVSIGRNPPLSLCRLQAMNLILLLSALLSALAGVSGQTRTQAPQALSQALVVPHDRSATVTTRLRPAQPLAGRALTALAPVMLYVAHAPTIATLLTNRRRE